MAGGIIFTVANTRLRDQFGGQVVCTRCGGESWDITLGGPAGERIECASVSCGQPADGPALAAAAEIGNVIATSPLPVDVPGLVGWLRMEQADAFTDRKVAAEDDDTEAQAYSQGRAEVLGQIIQRITLG